MLFILIAIIIILSALFPILIASTPLMIALIPILSGVIPIRIVLIPIAITCLALVSAVIQNVLWMTQNKLWTAQNMFAVRALLSAYDGISNISIIIKTLMSHILTRVVSRTRCFFGSQSARADYKKNRDDTFTYTKLQSRNKYILLSKI